MARDMIEVARAIQRVVPRKYKGWMEGIIANLDYVAPECRASRINSRIWAFIPDKPTEQWQFEAISIWSTKSVEEVKEIAKKSTASSKRDLDFHDPVLHAWEGDKVVCKEFEGHPTSPEEIPTSFGSIRVPIAAISRERPVPGKVYTVEKVEVRASSTNVILKEFPGTSFNSVIFSIA